MTSVGAAAPTTDSGEPPATSSPGGRLGSWIPTWPMITTRVMELRKRRGLMIALILVNIGIPSLFLAIRLISHAVDPKSYGPAGGYEIFSSTVAGVMYVFGFIVAAALGCTAGSIDLTEGMFRHLVVTGRSRLALYLARIPAGLAIVVPLVAIGFTVVCAVCVLAAPTQLSYQGVNMPAGLSEPAFGQWAAAHADEVICNFNFPGNTPFNVPCPNGPGPGGAVISRSVGGGAISSSVGAPTTNQRPASATEVDDFAVQVADGVYPIYRKLFLAPSNGLMIRAGLWIELEAAVGFIVGLGLGSLIGQRTIGVILMVVLELIITPILSQVDIKHFINAQRAVVGLGVAHLEPAGLSFVFGGGGGPGGGQGTSLLIPETRTTAVLVIIAWLVGWSALGAWRMMTRDS